MHCEKTRQEWPKLSELSGYTELQRRTVLRPHREKGFSSLNQNEIDLRNALDTELEALTILELDAEMGSDVDFTELNCFNNLFFKSPAFAQYLSSYLFFGVRFALSRETIKAPAPRPELPSQTTDEWNERPVALPFPPVPSKLVAAHQTLKNYQELASNQTKKAELFLDGFVDFVRPRDFELWLNGLIPDTGNCVQLRNQILVWAGSRVDFYKTLEQSQPWQNEIRKALETGIRSASAEAEPQQARIEKEWKVTNPLAARFGVADFYFLARLLRAEVSSEGQVHYTGSSWLRMIAMQSEPADSQILRNEEILRAVFDFACDLIQNSVEIAVTLERKKTKEKRREDISLMEGETTWRFTQDQETEDIRRQRKIRSYKQEPEDGPRPDLRTPADPRGSEYIWSNRIYTGEYESNLLGLAFSGGGIRSATIGLGVLERLRELDILRNIDYLSTVSGGGYIGAWLLGNVRRTRYWLGQLTNWDESIGQLRDYSKYLAPKDGVLSADRWSIWGTWMRNTLLIQLTAVIGLWTLLIAAILSKTLFDLPLLSNPVKAERTGVLASLIDLLPSSLQAYLLGWPQLSNLLKHSENSVCTYLPGLAPFWMKTSYAHRPADELYHGFLAFLTLAIAFFVCRQLCEKTLEKPTLDRNVALRSVTWGVALGSLWLFGGFSFFGDLYWFSAILVALACSVLKLIWDLHSHPLLSPRWFALVPWFASFLSAALLWRVAVLYSCDPRQREFSWIFFNALSVAPNYHLGLVLFLSYGAMALVSMRKDESVAMGKGKQKLAAIIYWGKENLKTLPVVYAVCISFICLFFAYLFCCIALWCLERVAISGEFQGEWLAYALGPVMLLFAFALAVVLFIGLVGNNSSDWRREWWTKFGSWVGIWGLGLVTITFFALFGPWLVFTLAGLDYPKLKMGAVLSGLATVVGALKAGNSGRTNAKSDRTNAMALQWLAWSGALVFIVGSVVIAATLLHLLLVEMIVSEAHESYWWNLHFVNSLPLLGIEVLLIVIWSFCAYRFDINTFSLNQFYRNRLVRCYLGATRWMPGMRHPDAFTEFDEKDDLALYELRHDSGWPEKFRGPFPIVNCALNLGGSADLEVKTRQSESFTFTPLSHGSRRVGYRKRMATDTMSLGQAISISGAAASPNMGYNTSPLVAFMLTMFNFRLGWWFPNPRYDSKAKFHGVYLVLELFGLANENRNHVNLSDGGHFENLAIYELIRRRTKVIIACDGECDSGMNFGSLGNLIRICQTDFGAEIDIDVSSIKRDKDTDLSRAHCAVGRISYCNGSQGYLIYLKSSITGDEDVGVEQYRAGHPDFPHETTADQFFSEDQFEAYRRLGHHIAEMTFRGVQWKTGRPVLMATALYDLWAPIRSGSNQSFVQHGIEFNRLWDRFRQEPALATLLAELTQDPNLPNVRTPLNTTELTACMELLQLMENVFLDMRLDEYWDHPDSRGWAMLFSMWTKSSKFKEAWGRTKTTFGIRFEYFCHERLGLPSDNPVVRVPS